MTLGGRKKIINKFPTLLGGGGGGLGDRENSLLFFYFWNLPLVRFLFCLMAILMILWDFMLLITVLYYHKTIEKGKRCQCWSWHHSYSRFTSSGECVCGSGLVYSLQDHLQGKFFFRFAGRRNIWKRHLERYQASTATGHGSSSKWMLNCLNILPPSASIIELVSNLTWQSKHLYNSHCTLFVWNLYDKSLCNTLC